MKLFLFEVLTAYKVYNSLPKKLNPVVFILPFYVVLLITTSFYYDLTFKDNMYQLMAAIVIGELIHFLYILKRNQDFMCKDSHLKLVVYACIEIAFLLICIAIGMTLILEYS